MTGPTTTVYVIGYDGDRWLPECVASLRAASTGTIALVLIDNYKNPCLESLDLSGFDAQVVKTPRRMGFADAHNFGVVAAPPQTTTAVMLNQDTRSHPGWLDAGRRCFDNDPKLGVLSPMIRTYDGDDWDAAFVSCVKECQEFDTAQTQPAIDEAHHSVPLVTGAAMMVRTAPMLEHGLFDPIFGSYYEDYDFCRRLARAGWHAGFCPAAMIGHYSGSATTTPAAERRRERLIQRNRIIEKLRLADPSRGTALLKHILTRFPHNLARGLARTPSSQPIGVTLGAHCDLLKLAPRLLNTTRDQQTWRAYLQSIDWPSPAC